MRRLVASALLLGLAAGAFVIWLATTPGLLNTAEETRDPARVAAIAAADLGLAALPPGVTPVASFQDGFQDRFVLTRLSAASAPLDQLLAALGLERADLSPATNAPALPAATKLDWWDMQDHAATCASSPIDSPALPFLRMTICADATAADLWHIYLQGHET